jgi:flagellar biogenesis protein FliO
MRPALPLARVAAVLLPLVLLASASLAQPITIRHATTQSATGTAQVSRDDSFSFTRVTLALGAVVSLILAFRWGARRFMIGGAATGHSRAVQVISRTIVSPKQQLMLVKVGRRLVLVANTAAGMNAICEIRDEQEVADLLGQVSADQGDSVTRAFGSLFRREEDKFSSPDDEPATAPGRPDNLAGDPEEAAIGSTRDELSGLMEKVRLVSKQFRRS